MFSACAFARAQEAGWPTKPIHFIVPLAPGGAIDFIARAVGEVMRVPIGQQIVVENRTGAGGTIGMDAAMKSAPDGYTVLITNDNAASAPHIMKLAYDYTKQLMPVCYLGRQPQFLAVHPSLGVNSVEGTDRLGEGQSGAGLCLLGRRLEPARRWRMVRQGGRHQDGARALSRRRAGDQRPDRGPRENRVPRPDRAVPALQGRHDQAAGAYRLQALADLPEMPTLEESGYKVVLDAWYAAFVPPGTPPAIVAKLNAKMNRSLKDPKLLETFKAGAVEPIGGTPEEIGKIAQADSVKYARLVKELNIKTN